MSKYAAKIESFEVVQVIRGDAGWAADRLGGQWQPSEEKVGVGWTYTDADGFRPPQPYPSWTWDGTGWQPLIPMPDDEGSYSWDENTQEWVTVDG